MAKTIPSVLSAARAAAELSQADIATQLGRSQSWVSRLEAGEIALLVRDVRRVARAYRISPSALLPQS